MEKRIYEIRKAKDLSQDAFGKKLGVTGATISRFESGDRAPTEALVKLICREFNVSSQYLRDGEGPMFVEPLDDADLVDQVMAGDNEFAKHLIVTIVKAGENDRGWEILQEALEALKKAGL